MPTTDPQDEVFDIVDEHDRVVGTATRGQVHADPKLIHRSVAILVFSRNKLFLQRRSSTKDVYPGYWTCSATGHVDSGETFDSATVRELREELGLTVRGPLETLTTKLMRYDNETELMRFYRYETDDPIVPDPIEVSEGTFVELRQPFEKSMQVTPCLEFIRGFLLKREL